MPPKYILAHDTGTGGNKAVLTDLAGQVRHTAYQSYPLSYPQPEWVEQDPEILWQAVASTSKKVLAEAGVDPADIAGVGISAQMWNTLPVDENCRPLLPMLSWLDLRSIIQAEQISKGDWPAFLYQHTGNIPTAKDSIPKMLWIKEERPDIWSKTAYLFDCKEYIVYKLSGQIATDWVGASAYFLFNPYQRAWSVEACERLGIPVSKLPPAFPCTQIIGEITPEAAKATGLKAGTPLVICAGDVAVAQTGAFANREGQAHLCIGTATWIGVSTSVFKNDPEKPFWGLSHIDPHKYIIAGEMETGGGALMWFREVLCQSEALLANGQGESTHDLINQMAEAIPAGAHRLIFLPWLSGERAPVLDHYARGAFIGLNMSHTKNHMARAVMEGVAYHLRWICEALAKTGLPIERLNAIGGGCQSPVWLSIIADVLGHPLQVVRNAPMAGAVGAALTVAVALGIYSCTDDLDPLIQIERVVEPNLSHQRLYREMYHEYVELYHLLAPVYRRLYQIKNR